MEGEGRAAPREYFPVPRSGYDLGLLDNINLIFQIIASQEGNLSRYQQVGLPKLPELVMNCIGRSKSVRRILGDPVEKSPPINKGKQVNDDGNSSA